MQSNHVSFELALGIMHGWHERSCRVRLSSGRRVLLSNNASFEIPLGIMHDRHARSCRARLSSARPVLQSNHANYASIELVLGIMHGRHERSFRVRLSSARRFLQSSHASFELPRRRYRNSPTIQRFPSGDGAPARERTHAHARACERTYTMYSTMQTNTIFCFSSYCSNG